jgi:hypothetical protein
MRDEIRLHCDEIDRTNQRGGRMLSIVDLIDAGTLGRDLAAYALAAIGRGASFLVGARPGGAGKTTVMGALLNFVPRDVVLAPADGLASIERMGRSPSPRRCAICHEIGDGNYYAYLWDAELRAYFRLAAGGHTLATNLHADTFEEARDQIVVENGVPEEDFRRMNLLFFLSVGRWGGHGFSRRIVTVWEGDGRGPHRRIFDAESPGSAIASALAPPEALAAARGEIDRLIESGARTIEEVRAFLFRDRPS